MVEIIVLLYMLLIGMDIQAIIAIRKVLIEFLIGARNKKTMQKIYKQQSVTNRINLRFIMPYLKKYKNDFKLYYWTYQILLLTLIPQYITVLVINIFQNFTRYEINLVFIVIKVVLNIFLRSQVNSALQSKYRDGK